MSDELRKKFTDNAKEFDSLMVLMLAENKQLIANHADMVNRNAALRDRPDIPTERIKAVQKLEEQNEQLKTESDELLVALKKACSWSTFTRIQYRALIAKMEDGSA